MAHILLPTDFSKSAQHAARYAVRLFGTESTYTLMHAYMDVSVSDVLQPSVVPGLLEASEKALREYTQRFVHATGVPNVREELRYGTVLSAVNERDGIDYVVMGRSGKGASAFFGTTAIVVAKHSKFPVLLVPEKTPLRDIRSILFASDHEEFRDTDLAPLRRIALEQGAEVPIVHVTDHVPTGAPHWDG